MINLATGSINYTPLELRPALPTLQETFDKFQTYLNEQVPEVAAAAQNEAWKATFQRMIEGLLKPLPGTLMFMVGVPLPPLDLAIVAL